MSLNLPLQNLLQNTQHMCSFCVLGRPCQISSAVLIRPIRAFCPWNLAWIWHLSLIWTNHNKSLSFSCFISWETAYFGIFVKKLALFLEITSARRGTSLRTALCVCMYLYYNTSHKCKIHSFDKLFHMHNYNYHFSNSETSSMVTDFIWGWKWNYNMRISSHFQFLWVFFPFTCAYVFTILALQFEDFIFVSFICIIPASNRYESLGGWNQWKSFHFSLQFRT